MSQFTLEQYNMLKAGKLSADERAALMDQILSCSESAQRFRLMEQFDQEFKSRQKKPVRYALGVAAVMAMAISPYLRTPEEHVAAPMAAIEADTDAQMALLDRVHDVNLRSAMATWGQETDLLDLTQMQNKR